MIKILHAEPFLPLGKAIPKPAPAAPQSREIKPGIWQAPDGKLRTDFATGQSVAPAQKAAPVTPLPVVPNALIPGDVYRVTFPGARKGWSCFSKWSVNGWMFTSEDANEAKITEELSPTPHEWVLA